jgi:peptide deformylase
MGNPILRLKANAVEPEHADSLTTIIPDMIATMRDAGGVGLAAPQIGISLRLMVFEVPVGRATNLDGDKPCGIQVLINPSFNPATSEKELGWEGCLSIPGLRGEVPRYKEITYTGFNGEGAPIETFASGFHARVMQHEMDHLDGILYPDRMIDLTRFGYVEEFTKMQEQSRSPDGDNKNGETNE